MICSGEHLFSCYVFIFIACCALPLPVQGLPECQQHLSAAFALTASRGPGAVSRLAPVGHRRQCPGGSVNVRKHLQMFLFWLQLVVRTQAHWQVVKSGEAPASVTPAHAPFSTFQSGCFSWQRGKRVLSCHTGSCRVPVAAHLPSRPAAAGGDALNLNPRICSAPAEQAEGAKPWGQHVPYERRRGLCSPRAGECCFAPAETLHMVSLDLCAWRSSFFPSWHLKRRKITASCF